MKVFTISSLLNVSLFFVVTSIAALNVAKFVEEFRLKQETADCSNATTKYLVFELPTKIGIAPVNLYLIKHMIYAKVLDRILITMTVEVEQSIYFNCPAGDYSCYFLRQLDWMHCKHYVMHQISSSAWRPPNGLDEEKQQYSHFRDQKVLYSRFNGDNGSFPIDNFAASASQDAMNHLQLIFSRGLNCLFTRNPSTELQKVYRNKVSGFQRELGNLTEDRFESCPTKKFISVHMRYGDKLLETEHRGKKLPIVEDYLFRVTEVAQKFNVWTVYLATDSDWVIPKVMDIAVKNNSNVTFIFSPTGKNPQDLERMKTTDKDISRNFMDTIAELKLMSCSAAVIKSSFSGYASQIQFMFKMRGKLFSIQSDLSMVEGG